MHTLFLHTSIQSLAENQCNVSYLSTPLPVHLHTKQNHTAAPQEAGNLLGNVNVAAQ